MDNSNQQAFAKKSSHEDDALRSWLQQRQSSWLAFSELSDKIEKNNNVSFAESLKFVRSFKRMIADVALARRVLAKTEVINGLEHLLIQANTALNKPAKRFWRDGIELVQQDVPAAVFKMRWKLLFVLVTFLVSFMVGWLLVINFTELIQLFASAKMIETVEAGKLWTDDLLNIMPSSTLAFNIATNNIMVTLTAFVLGAFYGVGTVYIMSINGLMLGAAFAFTSRYNLDIGLLKFIVPHGFVELSIIFLAGAAGCYLGEAIARPGQVSRAHAFREAVNLAGKLLCVCIPFLAVAGIIEGYISPDPSFDWPIRLAVGVGYWVFFIAVLTGAIWPKSQRSTNATVIT